MLRPRGTTNHVLPGRWVKLALAAAATLALVLPAAAGAGGGATRTDAFLPTQLRDAAAASPGASFRVIVQGAPHVESASVASDVRDELANDGGAVRGLGRTFRSISGVSAELTGRQILKLAARPGILAITPDVAVAANVGIPPVNATPPSVGGGAEIGATLTADPGSWTGDAPISYSFQWQSCDVAALACTDVAGARAATYVPAAADEGATLRVVVTATNDSGSGSAASATTAAVTAPATAPVPTPVPPVNASPPTISGDAVARTTLTGDAGGWTGSDPITLSYQWQRCAAGGTACTDVAGATNSSYDLTGADVGTVLRLAVTATNGAGTATAVSAATGTVLPTPVNGFSSTQLWPYAVDAQALWGSAAPATIAIVDSGVDASQPGLQGAVVHQVSLSSLPQADAVDGFGHGTFVAQVAAGSDDGHAGAAPGAKIVSLDVMDDNGRAMTSDVIAAADWIYEHKSEYGIRVANFSLIGSAPTSFLYDPLDKAVEKLWLSGVVVVAAAGNFAVDGAESGEPYAPANDPFVISVGADDVDGTIAAGDDFAAPWSAWGYSTDGFLRPDVSAPGRAMIAAIPTSSTLYTTRADRIVQPGYLQLSGTSFAAPVVSGLAAMLLGLHPDWRPDDVKGALMVSATRLPQATPQSAGIGEVDGGAAAQVATPPNPNAALERFLVPDPAGGPTPVFDAATWQSAAAGDPLWSAESWGTESWGTESWGTESWGTAYWQSSAWSTESWGTESWGTESWGTAAPNDGASADPLDPTASFVTP